MGLELDGSTGFLDCGDNLDGTADMTVSAWVRRNSTGARHEIFSKEGVGDGWGLTVLASNLPEFGVFDGAFPVVDGSTVIAAGSIYHLCGVRDDSAGLLRMYVNGVEESTAAAGGPPAASASNLNLGRRPDDTRYFDGTLEDLRVYNRVLSPAEIEIMYQSRGRDKIFQGLLGRWISEERAPGTILSTGGGGSFSIFNHQSNVEWGGTPSAQIQLGYTVPSGLSNPILVVVGGAENPTFANCQPSSCTFGATGMTKHVGTNTTVTYGAGTAIFTLAVSADDSGTITLTFPGTSGDGNTGRIVQAFVVEGGLATINTSNSGFNNGGTTSLDITTSADVKLGIAHYFTGDFNATTGPLGTGHTLIGEAIAPGGSSGFGARVGYFDAATAGSYTGVGFGFASGPNRSAMSIIALDAAPSSGGDDVPDQSLSGITALPNGTLTYTENIGLV